MSFASSRIFSFFDRKEKGDEEAKWSIYRKQTPEKYDASYQEVYSHGETIESILIDFQNEGKPVVAIDFFGPAEVFRNSSPTIKYTLALGVTLQDLRSEATRQKDEERNISLLPGNILRTEIQRQFFSVLEKTPPISLFVFRPCGGWQYLPDAKRDSTRKFYMSLFQKIFSHMAEDGVMLLQFPGWFKPEIAELAQYCDRNHIRITIGKEGFYEPSSFYVVKLTK